MKFLMSFMFVMPMILAAVPSHAQTGDVSAAEAVNDRYSPIPYPRQCPEGTRWGFDEYTGRYACLPGGYLRPRPLPGTGRDCPHGMYWNGEFCEYIDGPGFGGWREDRMKEMSGILSGDDVAAKGTALNGLFEGALSRMSGSGAGKDAVAVPLMNGGVAGYSRKPRNGGMTLLHTDPSVPVPSTGSKPGPRFLRVECTDSKGCNSPTVQKGVDVVKDAVDLYNKAQNYKREIEENEKKYKEGTEKWKDTQKDYQEKRKSKENIS